MATSTDRRSTGIVALLVLLIVAFAAPAASAQEYYGRRGSTAAAPADAPQAPAAPPARTGDEVVLEVGTDFASTIAQHPAGTHFRIAAGRHVAQTITPRDGDTYTGDAGAIMTGTVTLPADAFSKQGNVWVAGGQTAEAFVFDGGFHGSTEDGFARDAANNDLWAGDTRLQHVNSRGEVDSAGEWFFDYAADQVVVGTDPASTPLSLSVPWHAFRSDADNVTIQHITVLRYGSYAQHGAIHTQGNGWTVRHVTVAENHGAGITLGPGATLTDSLITRNGQIGVTAWHGEGIVVERNEISYNRTLQYHWGWEGGGTKFKETTGMVFTNNYVHHNFGPGVWFDIDNRDSVITSNLVSDNLIGVMVEISYGATIADNRVTRNGADGWGDIGSGLWVSNSSDVEVMHNDFSDNRLEILATHYERGAGAYGRYETTGLSVHHNAVTLGGTKPTGLRVYTGEDEFYTQRGNTFQDNTYRQVDSGAAFWWNGDHDFSSWQSMGFDVNASFAGASSTGGNPIRTPYQAVGYGHAA
ncbi:right-handed parallel beta-helix repeat-containing protein [Euzebya rosea]|uniref:right-handed parallel beta-helix repeat-containing protein n=1 Tax=Euzebya rosea TaxID=2052804 RepID=UPI000D3EAB91|nr:right-handed parallel beta-helix repeat-containing protein [Euzebya rosea]